MAIQLCGFEVTPSPALPPQGEGEKGIMKVYLVIGLIYVVSFAVTLFWVWSMCVAAKSDEEVEL